MNIKSTWIIACGLAAQLHQPRRVKHDSSVHLHVRSCMRKNVMDIINSANNYCFVNTLERSRSQDNVGIATGY
jgi:hypothetical protein